MRTVSSLGRLLATCACFLTLAFGALERPASPAETAPPSAALPAAVPGEPGGDLLIDFEDGLGEGDLIEEFYAPQGVIFSGATGGFDVVYQHGGTIRFEGNPSGEAAARMFDVQGVIDVPNGLTTTFGFHYASLDSVRVEVFDGPGAGGTRLAGATFARTASYFDFARATIDFSGVALSVRISRGASDLVLDDVIVGRSLGELVAQVPAFSRVRDYGSTAGDHSYELGRVDADETAGPSGCDCYLGGDGEIVSSSVGRDYGLCDGVLLHSGQEVREATDLELAGRDSATPFAIRRRHTTRINQENSPFGPAWAFNYRHTVQQQPGGSLLFDGFGRRDTFTSIGGNVWQGQEGRLESAVWDGASLLTIRRSGGTTMTFHVEGGAGSLVGHLVSIQSPNGNKIVIGYETAAAQPDLLKRRILQIAESYGRIIQLIYAHPSFPDLVTTIRDFSNREVKYTYDSNRNLIAVRSPVVVSTGGLNDFPTGRVKEYGYRNHADPRLAHALTSVTFPNQTAAGGETRLTWTYEENLLSPFFGFVSTHGVGNPTAPGDLAAGGTYQYAYALLPYSGALTTNTPFMQTDVIDRRGIPATLVYNHLGQLLSETTPTVGLRPGSPTSYTTTFEYNADGLLTRIVDPLGAITTVTYPGPSAPRLSLGNQLSSEIQADARGADQPIIRREVVYEPVFNRPFKVVDPRGFEPGNDPADFTRTYHYDYMEDLATSTPILAASLNLTVAQLQALFAAAGVVDLAADVNGDGDVSQRCGTVVQVVHPDVTLPTQAAQLGLPAVQSASEILRYNVFGQLIYHEDAEENVHEWVYNGANDPDGDGIIDVAGGSATEGGYVREERTDTTPGAGRNSGQNPAPVAKVTTFSYVAENGGQFPGNPRGVATAIIDPRGIKRVRLVNELDEVVVTLKAFDVSASPETGLTAFAYEERTLFDANGNVVEIQVQNKDGLDGVNDFIVHRNEYDILDFLKTTVEDAGGLAITCKYEYDANTNLICKTRGAGTPEAATESWTYDERDIEITHTRGVGAPEQSTTSTEIDDNGNFTAIVDATGDRRTMEYDGHDRLREVVDRVGNRGVFGFDAAGNVISEEAYGTIDVLMPAEIKLAQTDHHFDPRNRRFRQDRHLFHYAGFGTGGTLDDGALDPGDGLVSTITIHDRLNRIVATIDADADVFVNRWDGAGRRIATIDPLGSQVFFTYDPNDDLTATSKVETSPLITADEVFTIVYAYDSLGRIALRIEPNGQVTQAEYDSRDNQIRSIDELGNESEYRYDRLDRLVETRQYLSSGGTGASATNLDASQSGDGRITITAVWDALSRITSRIDDKGNATVTTWDDLSRQTRRDYADGTFEEWVYNGDDEVLTHTNQMGSVETWTHDAKGRLTGFTTSNAGASSPVAGSTQRVFIYDGLDRVWGTYDNNEPTLAVDDVVSLQYHDSLGRGILELQQFGFDPTTDRTVVRRYQGAARMISETYPNGREVVRSYDALDRVDEIREAGGALISRYDYVGKDRILGITYGNGATLDKRNAAGTQTVSGSNPGYDSNRRSVLHEWKLGAGVISSYANTYNGPGGIGTNRKASETRGHLFNRTDTYSFDSAYRMIGFLRDGAVNSTRTLDGADKMLSFNDEGTSRLPVVDGDPPEAGVNQYSSFDGVPRTYTDNGSLNETDAATSYVFDAQNRIVEVRKSGVAAHFYFYDGSDRRVLRVDVATGCLVRYVYSGRRVVQEEEMGCGSELRQYVEGRHIDDHVQMRVQSGAVTSDYYYHCNDQGFVGALTDSAGQAVEFYEYSWLGRARILAPDKVTVLAASAVGNPYSFQGRRFDAETGLYYFRHRYYDPRLGEFITIDPLGNWAHGQGTGYSAFRGDPWNVVDPLGLNPSGPVVIVTGFGPFPGVPDNPSGDVASDVGQALTDAGITNEVVTLDTVWDKAQEQLNDAINKAKKKYPGRKIVVISLGVGGDFKLETEGRNERGPYPDADGNKPGDSKGKDKNGKDKGKIGTKNRPKGPKTAGTGKKNYQPKDVVAAVKGHVSVTLKVSTYAGRYLCDSITYEIYTLVADGTISGGFFIHIPKKFPKKDDSKGLGKGLAKLLKPKPKPKKK